MNVGSVVQLDSYRERRDVRRAGAYALILIAVLGTASYLERARDLVDACIRAAAHLLPEEETTDGDA